MRTGLLSKVLGSLSFAAVLFAATASQAAIFESGDGLGSPVCLKSALAATGAGPCTETVITAHPLWQPNNPGGTGALWVSYDLTGYTNGVFQPHTPGPTSGLAGSWIFSLTESFLVGANDIQVDFTIWADDTVEVLLDGVTIFLPNFTQNICAGGVIGCEPIEGGVFSLLLTTPGVHTLTFLVYQIGSGTDTTSNPFGVLYAGTANEVPEPATLALVGLGALFVGGAAARRARRAK